MGTPHVIVVGTDYSDYAVRALKAAYAQAVQHAPAELHVVHVTPASNISAVGYPAPPLAELGAVPVLSFEEQQAELVAHLDLELATLPGFHSGNVRVFAHVLLDAPAFGVTRLASALDADLIVVGSHGRHGVVRWLLGSVAEGVVRQASCPVLVVPPTPPALSAPPVEPACPSASAPVRPPADPSCGVSSTASDTAAATPTTNPIGGASKRTSPSSFAECPRFFEKSP